jgi:hypothetical protein
VTTPAADGITVHRCVVRVVRRGGWSWGPDPQSLVRRVVDALPDLLAEQFAEHLAADGPDLEITEPVRVTVRLGQTSRGGAPEVLLTRLETAAEPVDVEPSGLADEPAVARTSAGTVTPEALFAALAERDELAALLALLPDDVFAVHASALLGHPPHAAAETETVVAAVVAELTRRSRAAPPLPDAPPVPADRAGLLRLLASLRETGSPEPAAASSSADSVTVPGGEAADAGVAASVGGAGATAAVGDTRVCAALPFLLVPPLARTGYLSAIGPALAGIDLLDEAPLFAAALAYKVLGAPERGWRRTGADHATAAAFAGLESAPELDGFAHRVRHALPVLDGVLALNVCRGHDPADPLVLTGVDDGLLLVDAQGMFPIAWAPDVAGLLPHWTACGRPSVAVCDSPLPPDCLRDLAAAGVAFVTDVRPLRGDPVTRLPRPTPLWTAGDADPRLAAALPAHRDRVTELASELFTARRAVLGADALDHSVALAASLALGLIAWTLWRDRETSDPVAALTRFADLEATVRYGRDNVHVRLPLGRRHADLLRHGALDDVHDVVWLDGRTLTFSGG